MTRVALYLILAFALLAPVAEGAEIKGLQVKVLDNNIIASAMVSLNNTQTTDLEKGVSKEIVVYFDLFRNWNIWPDEFITGRVFTQTLHCDPVKKEYTGTSLQGQRLVEKRFSSCERAMKWALSFPDFTLTNIAELEPAEYKVRVTVESRLRRLPPFINLLFFFVRETEFKISSDSPYFPLKSKE